MMNNDDRGLQRQDSNAKFHSRILLTLGGLATKFYTMLPFKLFKKVAGLEHRNTLPAWLHNAVFYQIYPQSFKDTNGDGIGDIEGIIESLDYLSELGVDALWLNPVFDSPFKDAGYDVRDFNKVADRYGSNEDLKRLFDEAKKRGMRVILDLVAGHCSDEHEWFRASANNQTNHNNDHFIWSPTNWVLEAAQMVKSSHNRKGYYRKNFYDCQPALNYGYGIRIPFFSWEQSIDSPAPMATRQAMKDVIEYWMELGASGFRVDLAQSLVKRDVAYMSGIKLWRDIRAWFENKWPEGVLVSEWGFPDASVMAGFHIDFMLPWTTTGAPAMTLNETGTFPYGNCYFDAKGKGSAKTFIKSFLRERTATAGSGLVSIPTANHDFQRPACGSRNSLDQLKALMLYNLTFSDLPVIYYGDEIGLKYQEGLHNKEGSRLMGRFNRAGSRTPMQWNKSKNAGFSTADESKIYLPIDSDPDYPSVEGQIEDKQSLLNFTKEIIKIKKSTDAFSPHARLTVLSGHNHNQYPLVYLRETSQSQFLVVVNPSNQTHNFKLESVISPAELKLGKGISLTDTMIGTEPFSYGMFQLN